MTAKDSVSVIYLSIKDSLTLQQNQKNALETKANTLIGFAGGMIALLMNSMEIIEALQPLAKQLTLLSISLFLVSILLATIVSWVRKYRTDPNPSTLAKNYLDKSEKDVQLQLTANLITAWEQNFKQLEGNASLLRIALFVQTSAFILLGLVLISSLT